MAISMRCNLQIFAGFLGVIMFAGGCSPLDSQAAGPVSRPTTVTTNCPELPRRIQEDLDVPKGCLIEVEGSVVVEAGATLRAAPGVSFVMGPAAKIIVGNNDDCADCPGSIEFIGSEDAPITVVGRDTGPAAWESIVLGPNLRRATFKFVEFQDGGDGYYGPQGAVYIPSAYLTASRSITVEDCKFVNNNIGLVAHGNGGSTREVQPIFESFARNSFSSNGSFSLSFDPNLVSQLDPSNEVDAAIEIKGSSSVYIDGEHVWNQFDHSYVLTDTVINRAGLTLTNVEVLMAGNGRFEVSGGGSLHATRVKFTGARTASTPGGWVGLRLHSDAGSISLDSVTIADAGSNGAAIDFQSDTFGLPLLVDRVDIVRSRFENNAGNSNILVGRSGVLCEKYVDETAENTFDLTPCL